MIAETKPLKILAIHGYRQSDTIFRGKLGSLRKGLKKDINFTFVRAPHLIPTIDCGNEQEKNLSESQNTYGWWFNTENREFKAIVPSDKSVGFQESVSAIENKFVESGPFDGIFGFSQGAAFATILCAMQQMKSTSMKFDFAIIVSGFNSLCEPHLIYYKEKIDIPSLHIYGENDEVIPIEMAKKVSELFINNKTIMHEGGHYIPGKKDFYKNFIAEMLEKKNILTNEPYA